MMFTVYSSSLLNIIKQHKEISIEDLKQEYIPVMPRGVISGQAASFNLEIEKFQRMGCITIEGDLVIYKNDPPRERG